MKKKGFTLIELLAVIIVLSVIALITVPIVINVIEKTRKESFKDSVLGAFGQIEYYLVENNLKNMPEEGIEIKNLELQNNKFSGRIIKNSEGKLEAVNVSDGKYCAQGEKTNLNVYKGECYIEVPTIEVNVNGKVAEIFLKSGAGVTGYAVTNKGEKVKEWIIIPEIKEIQETWEAETAGEYTAWVKDKYGEVNHEDFTIEENAFSYPAVESKYNATVSCTNGRTLSNGNCIYSYSCQSGSHCSDGCLNCYTCGNQVCGCPQWVPNYTTCTETQNQYRQYTCPNGGTVDGTTCIQYTCPNGGTLNETTCEFE